MSIEVDNTTNITNTNTELINSTTTTNQSQSQSQSIYFPIVCDYLLQQKQWSEVLIIGINITINSQLQLVELIKGRSNNSNSNINTDYEYIIPLSINNSIDSTILSQYYSVLNIGTILLAIIDPYLTISFHRIHSGIQSQHTLEQLKKS